MPFAEVLVPNKMYGPGTLKQTPKPRIGEALQRPVLSPDGNFIAVITPGFEIHIISLAWNCRGSRVTKRIILPVAARAFLAKCHLLKWSPETIVPCSINENAIDITSQVPNVMTWLVLSDGDRVLALSTELCHSRLMECDRSNPEDEESNILADFEVGKQFGKITLVDFVFSHRHVILLFETCTHASIVSLTKFQRDDVLLPKFPDARSFSQSAQRRHFALLTRSNGQDQVSVFSSSVHTSDKAQTFNTHTIDAQGIQWCPDGDPLLAIWDSASYGLKVVFFTALGHHLRHLDITNPHLSHELGSCCSDDLGVLKFEWLRRQSKTILTVAGPKHALLYEQNSKASAPMLLACFDHSNTIETFAYNMWQESATSHRNFTRPHTELEAVPHDTISGIEKVTINADCTMFATKDSNRSRTVWIWSISPSILHTVLNFREPVRQMLWHPALANVLLVLTNQRDPTVYIWHDQGTAPAIGIIPLSVSGKSSGKVEGCWLPNDIEGRHLFMLTSPEAFDIGFLDGRSDGVFFESVLERDSLIQEPPDPGVDAGLTPSRLDWKVMADARRSLTPDKDAPIHSGARGMKW